MQKLRREQFMLNPPSSNHRNHSITDDKLDLQLDEIDKQNNNYIPSSSSSSSSSSSNTSNNINTNLDLSSSSNNQHTLNKSNDDTLEIRSRSLSDMKRDFQVYDVVDFVNKGLQVKIKKLKNF